MNRRALHDAMTRLNEAMRVVRTREAQLDEERQERAAALRHGDGYYSGTELGDWSLGRIVGRGAMGEVYAAVSKKDERPAAVKVLLGDQDHDYLARFEREAEIARSTRGPNLVSLFETGQTADGTPYIVMELLEGEDLGAILRTQTSLPLSEVLVLVEQVARGLRLLHAAGVVHRDLKPSNLFRTYGAAPTWKILDYGVSKIVGAETVAHGAIVGTPGYMSPEQAGAGDVDARSDVFALGAITYRALTGRRPFSGADTNQLLYDAVHGRPTRPREILPNLPAGVEAVLAIALAKRREDRFATATELAEALRAAVEGASPAGPSKRARPWRTEPTTLTLPRAD
jgi:serine/threonine-protein kinase